VRLGSKSAPLGGSHRPHNDAWFDRAKKVTPGGVNSPVRAFGSVGGTPLVIRSAAGATIIDVDGREYLDFVGSWGPLILGHAHPKIVAAVEAACRRGTSYGAPSTPEIELAEEVVAAYPGIEQVRFVSSGTEAVMSAVRLARGATGRDVVVKFSGCYHGHVDYLLVAAGSGLATFGQPTSKGVPAELAALTRVLPLDDTAAAERLFAEEGAKIAAVIIEPVPANNGLLLQDPQFLHALRELCNRYGALLIFDEVISGFRLGPGGAAAHYKIKPDLATFGKVIGGGMPVGAFAGKREIMKNLSPEGGVYQAGTLSGNPVAVAAGLATLAAIEKPQFYERLSAATKSFVDGLQAAAKQTGVSFCAQSAGGMFGLYFSERVPKTYDAVMACDKARFNRFFHAMLDAGVYLAPSAFEAGFVSAAHTKEDIAATIERAEKAFGVR